MFQPSFLSVSHNMSLPSLKQNLDFFFHDKEFHYKHDVYQHLAIKTKNMF